MENLQNAGVPQIFVKRFRDLYMTNDTVVMY